MRIPSVEISRLKAANPIEAVAARYGRLHRSGANYKMLCPFHDDHHPSLSLHVAGQYFKCHACGAGGDVIGLVMGLERCSFTGAVEKLGGVLPESSARDGSGASASSTASVSPTFPQDNSSRPTDEQLRECRRRREANERFLASLVPCASGHSELSPAWLDFGVASATAFVPDDYRFLRGRTVFPIYNAAGELTGFAGRRSATAPESEPKYVNSPNSLLFDKSRMLYGIHRAAASIRRLGFAYLTEGYKDALAMHAAGFTNTVALGGTAFTEGQAEVLRSCCDRAVLLLDNDAAGQTAASRLMEEPPGGIALSALQLSGAKDADELFRRLGREEFALCLGLLTERVGAAAKRLLAFCLKYPEVAPHVACMLEADNLPFVSEAYRNLLHFTALKQSVETLPAPERLLVEMLSGILPGLSLPCGVPPSLLSECEEVVCRELADHFRFDYYEECILRETSGLAGQLRSVPAGSVEGEVSQSRATLLTTLARHVSQLVRLAENLSRTPALEARWL